jgi:hypothetical protein
MSMPVDGLDKDRAKGGDHDPTEICMPRPPVVKVIIVAEAPSPALMPIYRASRTFDDESVRRMIFAAGDPGRMLVRVQHFLREMWDAQEEEKMQQLYKLFHYGHLIYLDRSPADESIGPARTGMDATRREVDALLDEGVQAIVTLGDLAKNWVRTNYPPEGLMLVFLPLPSNHISSWYPSFLEKASRERGTDALAIRDSMAVQIDKLVRLCTEL